jgi:hypothetical protein
MRLSMLLAAATLVAGAAFVTPADAQAPGSYRITCRNVSQVGPILSAVCAARNGQPVASRLDVRGCVGDISNQNGRLFCARGVQRPPQVAGFPLPGGSWRRSCGGGAMRGPVLTAGCRTRAGQVVRASLDMRACGRPAAANLNGRLVCE